MITKRKLTHLATWDGDDKLITLNVKNVPPVVSLGLWICEGRNKRVRFRIPVPSQCDVIMGIERG